MIGEFTYDQIMEFSKELKKNADIIDELAKKQGAGMLQTLISNTEWYSTFLKNSVDLYKAADETLKYLKEHK